CRLADVAVHQSDLAGRRHLGGLAHLPRIGDHIEPPLDEHLHCPRADPLRSSGHDGCLPQAAHRAPSFGLVGMLPLRLRCPGGMTRCRHSLMPSRTDPMLASASREALVPAMYCDRRLRRNSRARWALDFAITMVIPRASAISVIENPSTSRMTITAR